MSKTRLGVIFGSRSVEHEVSIITAVQLMKHVDREKYEVIPIYIDKAGHWLTGPELEKIETFKALELVAENKSYPLLASADVEASKVLVAKAMAKDSLGSIDAAIICCHGTMGEDGTIQGLLELAGVPYQGPGVLGSAIAMDKIVAKQVVATTGINVGTFSWFTAEEWEKEKEAVLAKLGSGYPFFVKPATLGSSVGIAKAKDEVSLVAAIEVALGFDRRIIVERALENVIEVNVSVLGFQDFQASVPEQPIPTSELLSYADKYERGGGKKSGGMASLNRRIPAPIPMSLTKKLQEAAITIAKTCDLSGVARIDFFVNPETDEFWFGEINSIPGSMAFYLWEASGLKYSQLIDRLVEIAKARRAVQTGYIRSISTTIIK